MPRQLDKDQKSLLRFLRLYYYPVISIVVFIASVITEWYIPLALILTVVTALMVLDRLGKGIILRELIALHSLVICVFMPVLGFLIYTRYNTMARLWMRYMPISEEEYFSYALPATAAFVAVLCWPIDSAKVTDQGEGIRALLEKAREKLVKIPHMGAYLVVIGVATFFVSDKMPEIFYFLATLVFWAAFAGILYLYYLKKKSKYHYVILGGFVVFIFTNAIQSGMFTIVAYMSITLFSFFFLGKKTAFWKKLIAFVVGVFMLLLIQSVKTTYRKLTWGQAYEGNKVMLFVNLIVNKWNSTESFFTEDAFFPIYYRTNQGFNISLVMRRFPEIQPYDNGVNQLRTIAASLVPRLLWPNKPVAGGRFNMKYYTGITIRGWSTNVGPMGEAYGSFGPTLGTVYMMLLAGVIRWSYKKLFSLSRKTPLLLFWLPVLFYQVTYSAESDTLQIFNSLTKSAFFIWLLTKIFPSMFGIERKINRVLHRQVPSIQPDSSYEGVPS